MRTEAVLTIDRREYLERVTSKGFWIATVLMPLFMAALVFLPSLLLLKTRTTHQMAVVDETGVLGPALVAALAPKSPEPERGEGLARLGREQAEKQMAQSDKKLEQAFNAPGDVNSPEVQKKLAYAYIDRCCSPEVQVAAGTEFWLRPTNKTAELPEGMTALGLKNDEAAMEGLWNPDWEFYLENETEIVETVNEIFGQA